MRQGTWDIETVSGDTWEGGTISILVNGEPFGLTAAAITMQARRSRESSAVLSLSTADSTTTISIVDMAGGTFTILPAIITAPPGDYVHDIQITKGATVKTYVGGSFRVLEDIAHA